MQKKLHGATAAIHWEGDSKEILAGFPDAVRADLGFSLWQVQQGKLPTTAARRMESIGSGVWELKEQDERAWYRVLYLSKVDDVIHILHCFEKQGRKTDRRDLDIARRRLIEVQKRRQQQRKQMSNAKEIKSG